MPNMFYATISYRRKDDDSFSEYPLLLEPIEEPAISESPLLGDLTGLARQAMGEFINKAEFRFEAFARGHPHDTHLADFVPHKHVMVDGWKISLLYPP